MLVRWSFVKGDVVRICNVIRDVTLAIQLVMNFRVGSQNLRRGYSEFVTE